MQTITIFGRHGEILFAGIFNVDRLAENKQRQYAYCDYKPGSHHIAKTY
ncbi:MAG TPA: hypothetical protein VK172_02945 [Lentimicrobium sp.]|nr:hypothetical protein [Lentimicrobium sp.]